MAEGIELRRPRKRLVVVGEHGLVALDALPHEALADAYLPADDLGRQPVGRLHPQALAGVAEAHAGVVGTEDAVRLLADAHEHPVELEALVESPRGTGQCGLASGHGRVLGGELKPRQPRTRGVGERACDLDL